MKLHKETKDCTSYLDTKMQFLRWAKTSNGRSLMVVFDVILK